ncbi:hypothetical protein DDB_G0277059 [Dictyostelium discoideum AX4]|uniref:Uncharacterized protein n=1 Tax=Dictyostelium discoideum TaxID=44689 RepID=Q550M5_DICDI|nr:hypothetical protein DDB_G0277059 [Dictyostelium discoideum AX4]EAL69031.1 hypothetical protein DDB_G0277059 [Dictyostelium discoideum AX4]|eukprot:XP_642907.1 hypothetical protein DDB_G0277059 [Dictyostelium discoideum AX4]
MVTLIDKYVEAEFCEICGGHLSVMYDQVPTKRSEIGESCLKFNLPNHSLFIRRILICFKSKSIFDVFPEFKENFIKFNDGYPYLTNSNQCSKDQDFLEDDNIHKDDGGQCEYLDYKSNTSKQFGKENDQEYIEQSVEEGFAGEPAYLFDLEFYIKLSIKSRIKVRIVCKTYFPTGLFLQMYLLVEPLFFENGCPCPKCKQKLVLPPSKSINNNCIQLSQYLIEKSEGDMYTPGSLIKLEFHLTKRRFITRIDFLNKNILNNPSSDCVCPYCNISGASKAAVAYICKTLNTLRIPFKDCVFIHPDVSGQEYILKCADGSKSYRVDGFIKNGNNSIVIEFHGAYWHGHPKLKVDPLNENIQASRLKKTIEKDLEIVKHHLLVCWYFKNIKTYTRF